MSRLAAPPNIPAPDAVSVVVQGAIAPGGATGATGRCLESVRRALPGAEIILSTYPGSDTSGLSFDILVESDDPGALSFTREGPIQLNNVNRQIVTTQAGLARATRPYALKLRSDLLMDGAGLLRYFARYGSHGGEKDNSDARVFGERVLCCTRYARNPRRVLPYAFHPSDWFFFGRTDDVRKLFDIPLAPEPETSRWFDAYAPRPDPDVFPGALNRWAPEQYIWLSCLKRHAPNAVPATALPTYQWDVSEAIITASERTLAENFVLLSPRQVQIRFTKYRITRLDWASVYTHGEWLRLRETYCGTDDRTKAVDWEAAAKRAFAQTLILPGDAPVRRVLRFLRRALPFNAYERCWKMYRRILE